MRGGNLRVENFIDEDLEVVEGGHSTCGILEKIISTLQVGTYLQRVIW